MTTALVSAPVLTPHTTPLRSVPVLHVGGIVGPDGLVESAPQSQAEIEDAAARSDVMRLRASAAVPSFGALARVAALAEESAVRAGRRRDVRLVLELQVVVVHDEAQLTRRRSTLAHLDALAGLSWSPSATWIVTTPQRLVDDVLDVAAGIEVDDVVLLPLGPEATALLVA